MAKKNKEIYPVFEQIIQKEDKEKLLNQNAKIIWLTGLSGSGKTTLGTAIERELFKRGFLTQVIDGDNIRSGINNNLRFTRKDRKENIRRISEVSKLFLNCGVITINCFISPTEEIRNIAKEIIGKENFIEIFVNATIELCEKRDVKGLYKKAKMGLIKNFTGISSPFEIPENFDIEINTGDLNLQESVDKVLEYILPVITKK